MSIAPCLKSSSTELRLLILACESRTRKNKGTCAFRDVPANFAGLR